MAAVQCPFPGISARGPSDAVPSQSINDRLEDGAASYRLNVELVRGDEIRLTFSHLVLKVPTTHIRGADMSVTVHLDPIFNVESEKTSPESCRHNPEKL